MEDKYQKDFLDFMNSQDIGPPDALSQDIIKYVHKDLNPSHLSVFLKLLGIQGFIGVITLIFCPQFNLSLTNNYELFHYFHYNFGKSICMIICGSIFMGSGAVFASYILKPYEIRKIRKSEVLYYFSLTSIALLSFIILGAEVYLNLAGLWFVGSGVAGILLFEMNVNMRFRYAHNSQTYDTSTKS